MMVTWADVKQGDTLRADDGSLWHVEWRADHGGVVQVPLQHIQFGIHNGDQRIEVTYPATAPVERVETEASPQWSYTDDAGNTTQLFPATSALTEQAPIYAPSDDVKRNSEAEEKQAQQLVEDKLGGELIASETAAETQAHEAATAQDPEQLPEITEPLMLRSHLYLVHGLSVSEIPAGPEAGPMLTELHATAHGTGPMKHPHVHKPEEK